VLYNPAVRSVSKKAAAVFLLLGLSVVLVLELANRREESFIYGLNFAIYDLYNRYLTDSLVSDKILIVDIDEQTLLAVGQWPWPRYKTGMLIQAVADLKPKAIGLDVLMPEPDRTALTYIRSSFKRDFGIDVVFEGVPSSLEDNDSYLGHVLEKTNTVTANYLYFDYAGAAGQCELEGLSVAGRLDELEIPDAPGLLCNTEKLRSKGQISGFINARSDSDGIMRRVPLFIRYDGHVVPNLALAVIMQAMGVSRVEIEHDFLGAVAVVGGYRVPLGPGGNLLLNYPGPKGLYHSVPAMQFMNGRVNPAEVEGKIVVIGTSAAGLYDFHQTIFDVNYPGIETLAVVAGTILEENFLRTPEWGKKLSLILSLITGTGLAILFAVGDKPSQAIVGTVLWVAFLLGSSSIVFRLTGVFLPLAMPVLGSVMLFTVYSALRYGMERRTSYSWYQKLARSQQVTLESLATVVETRDYETGGHIKRTQHFVRIIAEQLMHDEKYKEILTPGYLQLLFISAPLHDIGKVGVPDNILLKPGRLTADEFNTMKKHTDYGQHILLTSGRRLGGDNFLEIAREIAWCHHEKWDGSGYPQGLSGENIPLSGRIMAIADVYDALTSRRCYKEVFSHEQALDILQQGRGSHFDPDILDVFLAQEKVVRKISKQIKEVD
jgi:adenylate cyclase